jgi:hypothetical protein
MVDEKKVPQKEETEPKSQRQIEIEELRKSRIPAGIPSANLTFPSRDGYKRRVMVDRPGRLEKAYQGGWRFVMKDSIKTPLPQELKVTTRDGQDARVCQVVGSHKDGTAMLGFLMEIPEELWQEDQDAKMNKLDLLESGMRQGQLPGEDTSELTTLGHTPIKIEHRSIPQSRRR